MKVKAVVQKDPTSKYIIEEVDLDDPREDEVLVKIVGSGVCHTDLGAAKLLPPEAFPAVFGHEGSGIVERVGSCVKKVKPGDHVILSQLLCGACKQCLTGNACYCENGIVMNMSGGRQDLSRTISKDGKPYFSAWFSQSSWATHALANERNVVKVSDDLPLELLGPLACGFQTGAGAVINALRPPLGSTIAIFGVGTVGLAATMGSVLAGCSKIIAVDIMPGRLKLAKEFGATHVLNGKECSPPEKIREIVEGEGVDFSLECTGNPVVFRQAVESTASHWGQTGLIGLSAAGTEVKLDMNSILFGRKIRGILEGDAVSQLFIPQLIEYYKQGRFPIDKLITYYPMSEINQAVDDMLSGKVLKAVIRP
jgi:aryl-alcohol dehydrogenase